jgi:hypothetical protein
LIEQLKVIFTPGRPKHVRQFALLFPASHPCKFSLEKVPVIHHWSQTYGSLSLSTYLHCSVVKTGTWTSPTPTLLPQGGLPLSV